MTTHWTERLSEYQDDELSPSERAACEAHLAKCQMCRAAIEDLRQVLSIAQADPDVMPANDLWPSLLERIETPAGDLARLWRPRRAFLAHWGGFRAAKPTGKRISLSLPQLALAASLLIAVSAGVTYVAAGRFFYQPTSARPETPIQAQAEPMLPPSADITPANFADAQFDRAVSDLERVLADERDELDPRTVMVIERNLAAIDEAIRQARAALDADPANQFLNSHLADARRGKLDLLRQAATLNSAGN